MLPGLWQIIFSLGIFAASRTLPRPIVVVGAWYLVCGLCCLAWARGEHAFSPWAMGLPFGLGQLFVAAVLLFCPRREEARNV
jgi:cyanate permease